MITNVYVDGFNLYYGCLKGTAYRWLDVSALCAAELPQNCVHRIRYFTARVSARADDPQQPVRQQTYLRALATTSGLTIHYGAFLRNPVRMALVTPPSGGPTTVEVWKTEEKGSDVNLATFLLLDAMDGDCDAAVVISNDSDLAEPIRQVRKRFGTKVVVLHPLRPPAPGAKARPNYELVKAASKSIIISEAALRAAQFPATMADQHGTITKPAGW